MKVDTGMDSLTLAKLLIREHGVAVIPGIAAFGLSDGCYLRIAYGALKPESARIGIRRLVQGLQSLVSVG
jgi:aspartate/methionine/tyrosine aminotransferase